MRSRRLAIAVGALVAIFVTPVSAAPPPGDSVTGVGIRLSAARVQYTVSVKEGAGGATGSFLYRAIDFRLTFGGPATCIDVDGDQAAIGGWITHSVGNSDLLGQAYLVFFEDNGLTGDRVSQAYIIPDDAGFIDADLQDFPASCPDAMVDRSDDPYEVQGNFVVIDN